MQEQIEGMMGSSSGSGIGGMGHDFSGEQHHRMKVEITTHPLYEQVLSAHVACLRVATPIDQLPLIDAQLSQSLHLLRSYASQHNHLHHHHQHPTERQELDNFLAQYLLLLCSFKEQLQQHVRVHAVEAVMACREIEHNLHSLTGELIKDFLKANASQLTVHGLICLQEELKERELCVFFRNNHFNTLFKLGGQLYLLATDQGYINQPDLVWEKLNEVNGNTVFMTGSFKEFKAEEDHVNSSWDEQNARTSTADYLASIDDPAQDNSSFDSDMQLAMALQEQEFEQQPQRNSQKQTVSGGSGLVTGPQSSRSTNKDLPVSPKPDSKSSKDKCVVM